jgi:spermidine/putrescine transport system permease protein
MAEQVLEPRVDPPPEPPPTKRPVKARGGARRGLWPALAAPGAIWLILFFVAPLYVVCAILFGQINPVLQRNVPVWNPIEWNTIQFRFVLTHIFGERGYFGPALLRTLVYVGAASCLCLLIAYPVSYYTARYSKHKGLLLVLLIAPFWISYMMRMLAWVNLLQNDGLVNKALSFGGIFNVHYDWLGGHGSTVIMGLAYGYVPYMVLPLFAGLDRIPVSTLEAARDLGAGRFDTFRRVTWRMSRPAVITSVLLTCLPMLGDYFTNDMLSASPSTAMVGNLINNSVLAPGQSGQGAAFVMIVLAASIIPMLIYVRSTRGEDLRV